MNPKVGKGKKGQPSYARMTRDECLMAEARAMQMKKDEFDALTPTERDNVRDAMLSGFLRSTSGFPSSETTRAQNANQQNEQR